MEKKANPKNKLLTSFIITLTFLVLFCALTVVVKVVDVKPIGVNNTDIGLSTLNKECFKMFGKSELATSVSEFFGFLSLATAGAFAVIGIVQAVTRKSLKKVDFDLYLLAAVWAVVVIAYVLFEIVIINYRPIPVLNKFEASYPSSHTLLAVSIMGCAITQITRKIKNVTLNRVLTVACALVIGLTIATRLLSGMHWITDMVAGVLLGLFFTTAYETLVLFVDMKIEEKKQKIEANKKHYGKKKKREITGHENV